MKTPIENRKNDFVRLRIDSVEKQRLEKLCRLTRRPKSDLVREGLFELYKSKYPECLSEEE
jgi:predicted DNA-binding protein